MNDWVKQFVTETEAAAEREICKRELLVHYALMVEQQVIIGNVLTDKSDNASDGLLSEETEKKMPESGADYAGIPITRER